MIFDAARLRHPLRLRADLCVVGSGAGGAMVAMVAAEAGLRVVVLEAGPFLTPGDFSQREEEMFPQLLWNNGGRTTTDRAVKIHQGRGVGGSTVHNTNLCKRIPAVIREQWRTERGLERLDDATWDALYDEVEDLLQVVPIPEERWNRNNRLLEIACGRLGWAGGGLRHNRTGCLGSGFCELGCAYDSKNNAVKVLIPRAVAAGAQVLTRCQGVRVTHGGGVTRGVEAVALDPTTHQPIGAINIDAPRVCLSASATATAAMLLRSRVPSPDGSCGDGLRIHPAVIVAGRFADPVYGWRGIPQTYECTEQLDVSGRGGHRLWILPAFAHPVATATFVPGDGAAHRRMMTAYPHLAVFTAVLHDHTKGRVRPRGELDLQIDYWPDPGDLAELSFGLRACAELLLAAGAAEVMVPTDPLRVFHPGDSLTDLERMKITRGSLDLTAVHPMATVPMGDDSKTSAVGSDGKHHHVDGLWIADGSLFPTSIGGPPQLSIYSLGLHVGRAIAAA